MEPEHNEQIARQIDGLATSSGLGFLLARVTVDGILEGLLDPSSPDFDQELSGRAYELLLRTAGTAGGITEGTPYAALSEALALAPEPGIPVGEEWQAIATALDGDRPAGIEEQLKALDHFRRFVIEERHGGTVVYRWFHLGLRDALRERAGGYESENAQRALRALLDLRERKTKGWKEPGRAGWFLLESLPKMVALSGDFELLKAMIAGAPEAAATDVVLAVIAEADAERALGHKDAAHRLNQRALLMCGERKDGAFVRAQIGQAESLVLDFEMWRDGRDMSHGALRVTDRLLEDAPDRYDLLEIYVRAARTLARALGVGGFDASQAPYYIEEALRRVAAASEYVQPSLAPAVAELLQSYGDSLNSIAPAHVQAETSAAAARIRGLMVESGREDLRLGLAESLGYSCLAMDRLGDRRGVDPFRQSLLPLLAVTPTPARWILPLSWMVSELSRSLVTEGREEEAFELLDRAAEGFAPTVETAEKSDPYRLGLSIMLGLRGAVLSAQGRSEIALLGTKEGFAIALDYGEDRSVVKLLGESLVGRLLEVDRPVEALGHLDSIPLLDRSLRALTLGAAARQRGDREEAVAALTKVLEQLDPGEPGTVSTRDLTEFVAFGRELHAGRELAKLHGQLGHDEAAEAALEQAATVFVRRQAGSPYRLFHLEPGLLAEMGQLLHAAAARELGPRCDAWLHGLTAREKGLEELRHPQVELTTGPRELAVDQSYKVVVPPVTGLGPEADEPLWPVEEVRTIEQKLAYALQVAREGPPGAI